MTALTNQPENTNFLSPLGYKLVIKKLPHLNFFIQSVTVPSVSLGTADIILLSQKYLSQVPS